MEHENLFARNGLFDARVPRYTSYPPANRFVPVVDRTQEADWIKQIPEQQSVSLYVHIPFCKRLCWFCACRTQGTKTSHPVESYIDALVAEIEGKSELIGRKQKVSRLHLGGGTPTILSPDLIGRLLTKLLERFEFDDGYEFSVEIDPTDVDGERLAELAFFGMTRASVGVQDFDAKVQSAIGRKQSLVETNDCIDKLRGLGVDDINLDVLYGLPFQTEQSLSETLDDILAINPNRIASFGYAHVPWMSRRQKMIPDHVLPDSLERLRLFQLLAKTLTKAGYIQIGIDHFVKPEDGLSMALANRTLRRNFQGYTDDTSDYLLGFGASSISKFPQGYLQNQPTTALYKKEVLKGNLCSARGITLSERQKLKAWIIESLMCYGRIDVEMLERPTPVELAFVNTQSKLLAQCFPEIVQLTGQQLHVPKQAYAMLRVLCARIDDAQEQTGSLAV